MQYGSGGAGSPQHCCELFNAAIGVNIIHVPYRGGGQAMQDLIAGLVDYLCPTTPIAIAQIEAKLVKAIALFARDRSPTLPALASAHETGIDRFRNRQLDRVLSAQSNAPSDCPQAPELDRRSHEHAIRGAATSGARRHNGLRPSAGRLSTCKNSSKARSRDGQLSSRPRV